MTKRLHAALRWGACLPAEKTAAVGNHCGHYLFPKKYGWNAIYYGENFNQEIDSITNLEEIINIVVERNNKEN